MFSVTVLKMKDIIKILISVFLLIFIIIGISKNFQKENNNEEKISIAIETGISSLSENSMLGCVEQVIPTMSYINEEYKNIAKEDDEQKEDKNILEEMLKTQISSIKVIEENINIFIVLWQEFLFQNRNGKKQ